jgi:cell division protein ZapA
MACEDGEEDRLAGLAAQVDAKIAEMRAGFGEIGDQRLTVMAAITFADQLLEAEKKIEALQAEAARADEERRSAEETMDDWARGVARALDEASTRVETMVHHMNAGGRKT